jgi:hypothetical protein
MVQYSYKEMTLEALSSLSEKDLQSKIIEPLLRAKGFTHVRDTSGFNDKGKDLVAIKEEFGKFKLYAIQIKLIKIIGKHSDPKSLIHLLNQFDQVFSEPVIDPLTNEMRKPDRCIFITPFAIKHSALESAISKMKDLERREITIVDGPLLVDEVLKYIPDSLYHVNTEYKYRIKLVEAANRITESRAFGIGDDLFLDDIYISMNINQDNDNILNIDPSSFQKNIPGFYVLNPNELTELEDISKSWKVDKYFWEVDSDDKHPHVRNLRNELNNKIAEKKFRLKNSKPQSWIKSSTESKENLEREIIALQNSKIFKVDFSILFPTLSRLFVAHRKRFKSINDTKSNTIITNIFIENIEINNKFKKLKLNNLVKKCCPFFYVNPRQEGYDNSEVASSILLKINHPVIIRGAPGAGKTTLLRKLSQEAASINMNQLPILIYLIKINKIGTEEDLIKELLSELQRLGYNITKKILTKLMTEGKCRIFLDGLDELGREAEETYRIIKELSNNFKKCPILITVREGIKLEAWNEILNIKISSFDSEQLNKFIYKWFTAEPSSRIGLSTWLDNNPHMREIARTPIMAALLCVLYKAGADLPTTEVELYERRFELLLGRWEQAKGIVPIPPDIRKRYLLFLMELAFVIHGRKSRAISYNDALALSKEYFSKQYHGSGDAFMKDCIHRGVLQNDLNNNVSFGHLTYQEFMVGKWLVHNNQLTTFWKFILDPWWNKSIEFYVSIRGDISGIFFDKNPDKIRGLKRKRIKQLLLLAPYTSPKTIQRF